MLYLIGAITVASAGIDWRLKATVLSMLTWLLRRDVLRIEAAGRRRLHLGERLAVVDDDADWPVDRYHQIGGAIWLEWRDGSGVRRDLMLLPDSFECAEDWHLCRLWARQRTISPAP